MDDEIEKKYTHPKTTPSSDSHFICLKKNENREELRHQNLNLNK